MTPEQIREQEILKAFKEEQKERIRQQRIQQRDMMIGQNYSKSHIK